MNSGFCVCELQSTSDVDVKSLITTSLLGGGGGGATVAVGVGVGVGGVADALWVGVGDADALSRWATARAIRSA